MKWGECMYDDDRGNIILTAQVVSEVLERLSFVGRIVLAAYYLDGYDIGQISKTFEIQPAVIITELYKSEIYVSKYCDEYSREHRCQLQCLNKAIWKEAYEQLFRRRRYKLDDEVSIALYKQICVAVGA